MVTDVDFLSQPHEITKVREGSITATNIDGGVFALCRLGRGKDDTAIGKEEAV